MRWWRSQKIVGHLAIVIRHGVRVTSLKFKNWLVVRTENTRFFSVVDQFDAYRHLIIISRPESYLIWCHSALNLKLKLKTIAIERLLKISVF